MRDRGKYIEKKEREKKEEKRIERRRGERGREGKEMERKNEPTSYSAFHLNATEASKSDRSIQYV